MTIMTVAPDRSASDTTVVERMVDLHPRKLHLHAGLTPLQAREMNLRLTCEALDSAELTYFVVPGGNDEGSVVGVLESQRSDVLRVLGRLFERAPGYVNSVVPAPRQRSVSLPGNGR